MCTGQSPRYNLFSFGLVTLPDRAVMIANVVCIDACAFRLDHQHPMTMAPSSWMKISRHILGKDPGINAADTTIFISKVQPIALQVVFYFSQI